MDRTISRRSALAGTGAAIASAGCIGRARNLAGRDRTSQLALEITTLPADSDPNAIRIARHLSEHLNEVGIDARVDTMAEADLRRSVLLNHDFDMYVGQYTETKPFDPDALYALTHSSFTAEPGWQNPFGFTELAVDDLLDEQRSADDDRRGSVVDSLQEAVCDQQPFTLVAFPDTLTAINDSRYTGWETARPTSVPGLLQLTAVEDIEEPTLRLTTTDERITENWNPIAAEYRRHGTFTALLYDPLARIHGGTTIPWLAADWEWTEPGTLRIELREATWHDDEPLTASDVAFTYEFLTDTSMGSAETPIPTPKFRGRSSVVQETTVVDGSTVDLHVGDVNRTVGERALQLPILPEHVWEDLTDTVAVAGIEIDGDTTEALVWNNEEPVGSGPLRFADATADEEVVLERNPDHFLQRLERSEDDDGEATVEGVPTSYVGQPAFDSLVLEVVPSDIAGVQQVGDSLADATASNLGPDAVPRIGREADARLVSTRSAAFYHIGYNVRRAPLSNPRFRGILAGLIDKAALIDDAFDGYAEPATSPLARSPDWVPESLSFTDGADAVYPFYGDDGDLAVEEAQDAFREAGYRFNEAGELLARDQ